jgi:hypothetical protein
MVQEVVTVTLGKLRQHNNNNNNNNNNNQMTGIEFTVAILTDFNMGVAILTPRATVLFCSLCIFL